MRTSPNIIITGTPGVGKTTHCEQLASSTGLTHLNVNKVVKERDCEDGFDDELNSVIVDEDKLLDAIEPDLEAGGQIIDWHACDMFPQSLIDLVVVIRCNSTILYDRLKGPYRSALFAERNLIEETNFGPSLENNGLVARAFRICKCTHGLGTLVLEASKKLVELLDTERLHKPFTESR
ncbi:hypothetical protein D6C94_02852 [Aureobasidium pullulans]|uniref:Adenylate kinase isoenzyme 6 homolog n=1 Tax=Aureobasidium pullulans TaxID=5580 RepID=A0AB38M5U8_AURPU|nr:hypothetical protein D6C94_02852 [Aureobasidium pullulans]